MAATSTLQPANHTPPTPQPETSRSRAWPAPTRNNVASSVICRSGPWPRPPRFARRTTPHRHHNPTCPGRGHGPLLPRKTFRHTEAATCAENRAVPRFVGAAHGRDLTACPRRHTTPIRHSADLPVAGMARSYAGIASRQRMICRSGPWPRPHGLPPATHHTDTTICRPRGRGHGPLLLRLQRWVTPGRRQGAARPLAAISSNRRWRSR